MGEHHRRDRRALSGRALSAVCAVAYPLVAHFAVVRGGSTWISIALALLAASAICLLGAAGFKAWLNRLDIPFEERDLTDPAIMAEAKARTGVRIAPITVIGNQVFYGTFQSQKARIAEALTPAVTG